MNTKHEPATLAPERSYDEQWLEGVTRLQDAVDSGELERVDLSVDSSFVARGASMAAREIARVSSYSIIGANVHYDTAESSSGLRRLAGEVGKKLMSRLFPGRYPPHVLYVMHSLIDNVYLPKPGEIKNHGAPTTLLRDSTVLGFDNNGTDFGMARVERGAGVSDSTVFGPVKIGEGARVTNSVVSDVCPQPVPIVGEDAVVTNSDVGYLNRGEELRLPGHADEATVTRVPNGGTLFEANAK